MWEVIWQLPRPYSLLENGHRCSVHPVKPQGCRVFPESAHLVQLKLPESNPQSLWGNASELGVYPCFQKPVNTEYLTGLEDPLEQQILRTHLEHTLSELFLFQSSPLLIDITPNLEEIAALDSQTEPGGCIISQQGVVTVLRRHENTFRQMARTALMVCRDRNAFERVLDVMDGWMGDRDQPTSAPTGSPLDPERPPSRNRPGSSPLNFLRCASPHLFCYSIHLMTKTEIHVKV